GLVLVTNDDDPLAEGTLDAGIRGYTVLSSGVYLIVATRFGDRAGDTEGSYALSVEQTPPDELGTSLETARLMDYGMTVEGEIDQDVPVRYYRFNARRGDVITAMLSLRSGGVDLLLRLLDEHQNEVVQDDDGGDGTNARIAAYTLPASGTYYLLATHTAKPGGARVGGFSLQLSGRAGVVGGRALEIVYGATVSGIIDNTTSSEEYVFFGQQGDVIRISMERASGDLDALVTLYDSERKQIMFDDDGGNDQDALIQQFILPRDDMYILVASRFDRDTGTTSGAYILTLDMIRSGG
ncbi:MAG: PPC domain-containing protein, partial [Anaerolineae bacterium]|nr:PPC domain-containing protein [Anaerolineae bacterium]